MILSHYPLLSWVNTGLVDITALRYTRGMMTAGRQYSAEQLSELIKIPGSTKQVRGMV